MSSSQAPSFPRDNPGTDYDQMDNDGLVNQFKTFWADHAAPATSLTLLKQVNEGDAEGWSRFILLYRPVIERWLRRLHVNNSELEDVYQEVFLALAKQIPTLEPDEKGCSFRRWLWVVTRSKALDSFRRSQSLPRQSLSADGMDLPDLVGFDDPPTDVQSESALICRAALNRIRASVGENVWNAFWLTVIEELDPSDVAERLEMSRWAVYKARTRTLTKVRHELSGLSIYELKARSSSTVTLSPP